MQVMQYLTRWTSPALTDLSFLFVLLPLFLFCHRLAPKRFRPGVVLALSLVYYGLAQPDGLPLLLISVLLDYCFILAMKRYDQNEAVRRVCLGASVTKGFSIVVFSGLLVELGGVPPMLGTVVCAVSGMSAVADAYRREVPPVSGLVGFGAYCCFFPRLHTGPLYTCAEFDRQLQAPDHSPDALLSGFGKYVGGAFKARVMGGQFAELYLQLAALEEPYVTVLSGWFMLLSFALAVYFTLSGFGDMAQGIGLLFGFRLPKNFYYPYQSRNVCDFFERFLMTVGQFVNRYLCAPLKRLVLNPVIGEIMCCLVLGASLGLWFGFRANCLAWGLLLAFIAVLERRVYPKLLRALPTLLFRLITFCAVLISFAVLSGGSFADSLFQVKTLFGFAGGIVDERLLYILASNWMLLLLGCFLSTNVVDIAGRWLGKSFPRGGRLGYLIFVLIILASYVALTI